MISREEILNEIKRTAKLNDGKPLGRLRFFAETGIKDYDWGRYWARYGDLQREAGFEPNKLNGGYTEEFIFKKIADLIKVLGKFPTPGELRLARNNDFDFPDSTVFRRRFGTKIELAKKIMEYSFSKEEYKDVWNICADIVNAQPSRELKSSDNVIGEVYLFKSGRFYKIGKTKDTVRRGSEIRIQLPEKLDLIHSIKTDDPSGIEAYWHRRFADKRKNGEWFDLDSADISAFKRWKKIF